MTPIVSENVIDALAHVYTDFDRGFNRTKSRGAVDGALLLLALLDELRAIRGVLEQRSLEQHQRKQR